MFGKSSEGGVYLVISEKTDSPIGSSIAAVDTQWVELIKPKIEVTLDDGKGGINWTEDWIRVIADRSFLLAVFLFFCIHQKKSTEATR